MGLELLLNEHPVSRGRKWLRQFDFEVFWGFLIFEVPHLRYSDWGRGRENSQPGFCALFLWAPGNVRLKCAWKDSGAIKGPFSRGKAEMSILTLRIGGRYVDNHSTYMSIFTYVIHYRHTFAESEVQIASGESLHLGRGFLWPLDDTSDRSWTLQVPKSSSTAVIWGWDMVTPTSAVLRRWWVMLVIDSDGGFALVYHITIDFSGVIPVIFTG